MPESRRREQLRSDAPGDGGVATLTAGVARGDASALAEFYEAWFDRSFHLARRLTRRDESFCLDVVQDAMLRVAKSMRRMETPGELERWMTRVVHTAALDRLRAEARRAMRERRRAHVASGDGSALEEQVRWLRAQLAELGPEERTMLSLRFVQGRTLEETGEAVGMTGDAAHGRLRRILTRLRGAGEEVDHE